MSTIEIAEWHVSTVHGSMNGWMPLLFSVSKDGW